MSQNGGSPGHTQSHWDRLPYLREPMSVVCALKDGNAETDSEPQLPGSVLEQPRLGMVQMLTSKPMVGARTFLLTACSIECDVQQHLDPC